MRIVLEAAAQVLCREGHARATTNRIAEKAGVSVGTVYQYFSNKDALFEAMAREYATEVLQSLEAEPLDPSATLAETLQRSMGAAIAAQRHGPEFLRALEQVPNRVLRRQLAEVRRRLVARVRAILEMHRSSLRPLDLDRATLLMVNALEGIGYNATADAFDAQLVDDVTTLFVRYLVDH